jgi:hypothetical protein
MRFIAGAPHLAEVVWDVGSLAECIHMYRAGDPSPSAAGDIADAEPAVPGWRVAVDWISRDGCSE